MELGLVGLGKMGGAMVYRLTEGGHRIVGFDLDRARREEAERAGATTAGSLEGLVDRLGAPRAVWIMVPHGEPTRQTIHRLAELLEPGDTIVDGGNSRYTRSMEAAERCREEGVRFLDAGVSGGIRGLEEGYCLMVGGPEEAFRDLEPVFRCLAPENGYARVGPSGAGHFVKMIHNGIEYGMLQALGEGFECLQRSDFDLDLREVAELWQHGAVVRSWLLAMLADAYGEEGNDLERIAAYVDDSGMGRWTVEYAVENAIPAGSLTHALYERFDSRLDERYAARVVAALRKQFGGHEVKEEDGG